MSYSSMLALVKTAVSGVTNIGQVHDYRRYWDRNTAFKDLFQTTIGGQKQIRGWDISRVAVPENERDGVGGRHLIAHRFQVRGFLSVEDSAATEKTFQALVDAVLKRLDENVTLAGGERGGSPSVATTIAMGEIAGVTCHVAEIEFTVVETVTRTYS